MKFLMGLLAALFMVGTAQAGIKSPSVMVQDAADKDGYFWNMKVGSEATFAMTFHTDAGDIEGPELTMTLKEKKDKLCTYVEAAGQNSGEYGAGESGGYYCWGQVENGKWNPIMSLVKLDAKIGDTWDGWAGGRKEGQPEVTVKYVEKGELKVAFGVLKDVIHVQATVTGGPVQDFWFAPGKGLVKQNTTINGTLRKTIELSKFTEGK